MVTRLRGVLRREISIGGEPHVVTVTDDGVKIVEKGRRKGIELAWKDLVTGDAALASALSASFLAAPPPRASDRRAKPKRILPARKTGRPSSGYGHGRGDSSARSGRTAHARRD